MHLATAHRERHGNREHRELLATQDRLREAHEVARLSSWEWLPDTDEVVVFQALPAAGALPGSALPLDGLLGAMSPDDRRVARQDLAEMTAGRREESTRRCCYELPDGNAWLETRSRAVRDEDGRLTSVRGTTQDVTEQQLATQELLGARNYLGAVTDGMGEGLCTTDPHGLIVYMNRAARTLLGWDGDLPAGHQRHCLLHESCGATADSAGRCAIARAARDGVTVRGEDDQFARRDGSLLPVTYTAAPFVTADGVEGCAVVFADATERKAREAAMERDVDTLSWIRRIKEALTQNRFELFAQPIVDLRSGTIVQRELLLRLSEPDGGVIGPAVYLPIAEQYGLVADIDRWVIGRACEIAAEIGAVHINLSARSLEDPTIVDWIERCIERTGADPSSMIFEITETALIADEVLAKDFAVRIHGLGCKLALDDFGTGYGGFTYLKRLPVDMLKIDCEFVRDLSSSAASRHVVVAVVALARAFDLLTVAEGVEDARTLSTVRDLGVDMAQGFQIARPARLTHPATHPGPVEVPMTGVLSSANG